MPLKKYAFVITTLLLVSLILFMYWNVYTDLFDIWDTQEEYSHGFIIPLVSVYFLWEKKSVILKDRSQSTLAGFAVLFLSLVFYFIGVVGDLFSLLRVSFILLLIGLALLFVGYKSTKAMLIPILILIFSFPIPPVLQAELTVKLQLLSSQLGVAVIRAFNIPVFLEGNVIDLGSYQLQVVEACSGLRYLFPLMSLAFICVYLYQVALWKRIIVFFTAIPITLLMNSFRIGVIGVLVNSWGIEAAEGFTHDFEGWVVFIACLAILFLEMWLLSWRERKLQSWGDIFGLTIHQSPVPESLAPFSFVPLYSAVGILCFAVFFIKPLGSRADFIPPRQSFLDFPLQIADWKGVRESLDLETVKFLALSDYVLINFSNHNNQQVNFYAAYYQTQKHGAVPHSPKQCISGGGWQIQDISSTHYQNIHFNRVLVQKNQQKQVVYYWYKQRDKAIANEYDLKWNTFLGAFENRRTDAALVRLTTNLATNESLEEADNRLKQFLLLVNQNLPPYIPN
jgi:exosortase D (VPLPA-CTERM-specific)